MIEIILTILTFVAGIGLGAGIVGTLYYSKTVGELMIVDDHHSEKPYMFLRINESDVDDLKHHHIVKLMIYKKDLPNTQK